MMNPIQQLTLPLFDGKHLFVHPEWPFLSLSEGGEQREPDAAAPQREPAGAGPHERPAADVRTPDFLASPSGDSIPWYRPFVWVPTSDAEASNSLNEVLSLIGRAPTAHSPAS